MIYQKFRRRYGIVKRLCAPLTLKPRLWRAKSNSSAYWPDNVDSAIKRTLWMRLTSKLLSMAARMAGWGVWNRRHGGLEEGMDVRDSNYEPADIVIYVRGKGIVLKEKSLVAYEETSGKILAIGTEAAGFGGRGGGIVVGSPLRQGKVADYASAAALFQELFKKAMGKKTLCKPPMAVCAPGDMTEVEKRALEEVIHHAGAKELLICDVPMEEFLESFQERYPKLYPKYKVTVGITKEEPARYIMEGMEDIRRFAGKMGVSMDTLEELWKDSPAKECQGIY